MRGRACSAKRNHSPPGEQRVHGAWNFLFDPDLPVDLCPAVWRAEENPTVVVLAQGRSSEHLLGAMGGNRRLILDAKSGSGRHLVFAEDSRRHRVLLTRIAVPWPSCFLVPDDETMALRLAALTAFQGEKSSHNVALQTALKPTRYHAHRLRLLLAILDRLDRALPSRPSLREIATDLIFPGNAGGRAIDWKTSSHRRQAQRLVAEARQMRDWGFRDLLKAQRPNTRSSTRTPPFD